MREKLTTLQSNIAASKSTLLDQIANAEVLNRAMLNSKLEELEIESIQKCDDGVLSA